MVVSVRVCVQWNGVFALHICVFKNWQQRSKKNVNSDIMCEWPCRKSNPLYCSHRASTETKEKFAFAFAFLWSEWALKACLHVLSRYPSPSPFDRQIRYRTHSARQTVRLHWHGDRTWNVHWRIRTWIRIRTRTLSLIITLYYAELFTLVQIWIQILVQIVSRIVTVPILGTDVHPKDRYLSQFYYISIRGSESVSEPMWSFCIVQESMSESESESGKCE